VFDGQAGLHQNGRRDFDPAVGGYVESDPIGLMGGTNTYAYVRGTPINRRDPQGLADEILTPPDPSESIDDTGAGTKAYNAWEVANRQADELNKAAQARARGDGKDMNDHLDRANTFLNDNLKDTAGKPQDAPTAPRGPEPEKPLPPGTIKSLPLCSSRVAENSSTSNCGLTP